MEMEIDEKRERRRRQRQKCVSCIKQMVAGLFSHVGLAVLVVAYSIMGGFLFKALEAPNEMKVKLKIIESKEEKIEQIWLNAANLNLDNLDKGNFTERVRGIFLQFQLEVKNAVKDDGWDGKDSTDETTLQWSFAGALLYAVTVITTIGYGHIAPKTAWGRLITILYALLGIPLTFLYLSNIGNVLADMFRMFYKRICCDLCCCQKCERNKKRERYRMRRRRELAAQRNSMLRSPSDVVFSTVDETMDNPECQSLTEHISDNPDEHDDEHTDHDTPQNCEDIEQAAGGTDTDCANGCPSSPTSNTTISSAAPSTPSSPTVQLNGAPFPGQSKVRETAILDDESPDMANLKETAILDDDLDSDIRETAILDDEIDEGPYMGNHHIKTPDDQTILDNLDGLADAKETDIIEDEDDEEYQDDDVFLPAEDADIHPGASSIQKGSSREPKLQRERSSKRHRDRTTSKDGRRKPAKDRTRNKSKKDRSKSRDKRDKEKSRDRNESKDKTKDRSESKDKSKDRNESKDKPKDRSESKDKSRDKAESKSKDRSESKSKDRSDSKTKKDKKDKEGKGRDSSLKDKSKVVENDSRDLSKSKKEKSVRDKSKETKEKHKDRNHSDKDKNKSDDKSKDRTFSRDRSKSKKVKDRDKVKDKDISKERSPNRDDKKTKEGISKERSPSDEDKHRPNELHISKERSSSQRNKDHGNDDPEVAFTRSRSLRRSKKENKSGKKKESKKWRIPSKRRKSIDEEEMKKLTDPEGKGYYGSDESFVTAHSESFADELVNEAGPSDAECDKLGLDNMVTFQTDVGVVESPFDIELMDYDMKEAMPLGFVEDPFEFEEEEDNEKVTVPISICLIIIAGYIFGGSLLFSLWEDWDYLTGSYFCFITLSTIGFGDIVPGTDMKDWASHEKLVLCALWLAFGLSLLAMCFNLMQEEVKEKCKWLGMKLGLLKKEDEG